MSVSYDAFSGEFLNKISDFDLGSLSASVRTAQVDGYMKRALSKFKYICEYDLLSACDDTNRVFNITVPDTDLLEIVDIVSDGMVEQWLKPYVNRQEVLENAINTKDFTTYSPAELLMRIGNAYAKAQKDYTTAMYDYSYNHGDITDLHI